MMHCAGAVLCSPSRWARRSAPPPAPWLRAPRHALSRLNPAPARSSPVPCTATSASWHIDGQDDDGAHLYYTGKTYKIGEVHEGGACGLDGAGAGAWHHHHVRRDDVLGPRREGRGSAMLNTGAALNIISPAWTSPSRSSAHCGPRRRYRLLRRRRWRRAADRDGVAPGEQVQRAAHVLPQQDGPHGRGLLLRADDQGHARRHPPSCSCPSARRATSWASSTSFR